MSASGHVEGPSSRLWSLLGDEDADGTGEWRTRVVQRSLDGAAQRSIERSLTFVRATFSLLEDRGDEFTIQDVCDRAGLSLRLFYQHFDGKADLLSAVFEEAMAGTARRTRHEVTRHADPLDRLTACIIHGVQITPTPASRAILRYSIQLQATNPAGFNRAYAPHVELMMHCIDDAIASGDLPTGNTGELAYFALALRTAYNHSTLMGNETAAAMPTPEQFAAFVVRALAGRSESTSS